MNVFIVNMTNEIKSLLIWRDNSSNNISGNLEYTIKTGFCISRNVFKEFQGDADVVCVDSAIDIQYSFQGL